MIGTNVSEKMMLIKQVNQNSVISFHFFHYLFTILNKGLKFQIDV